MTPADRSLGSPTNIFALDRGMQLVARTPFWSDFYLAEGLALEHEILIRIAPVPDSVRLTCVWEECFDR